MNGMRVLFAAATFVTMSPGYAFGQENPIDEIKALARDIKPFSLRVIGPPVSTPEWIFLEKPFWSETVKELSLGKVRVQHNSVTEVNVQPGDVFTLTARGLYDIADVTANYGSGELAALDGFDLAGIATTWEMAGQALDSYAPVAAKELKERFNLILLGYGASGAQVLFCRGKLQSLEDLKGKKIRVSTSTLADFLSGIGATPISLAFGEVLPAMQRGVVDCVITGAMGGNTAKLYEVADTMYTLQLGWAPKIRIINGKVWARLDNQQKLWLKKVTDYYYRYMSDTVQFRNLNEGVWCSTNDDRCTMEGKYGVVKANLQLLEPSEADLLSARKAVVNTVLPAFAKACGAACVAAWNDSVGKTLDMQIK